MKKFLFIALLAVFAASTASAQGWFGESDEEYEVTITVPPSQSTIIEKLFTAWGKKFPGRFVEAYHVSKKTGETENVRVVDVNDSDSYFKVDCSPKNGFIETSVIDTTTDVNGYYTNLYTCSLTAVYWNLPNGNKLFGVCFNYDGPDIHDCDVGFYEYNADKGVMTPNTAVTDKVREIIGSPKYFVQLPKIGRDIEYYDPNDTTTKKTIKWNGNGF